MKKKVKLVGYDEFRLNSIGEAYIELLDADGKPIKRSIYLFGTHILTEPAEGWELTDAHFSPPPEGGQP